MLPTAEIGVGGRRYGVDPRPELAARQYALPRGWAAPRFDCALLPHRAACGSRSTNLRICLPHLKRHWPTDSLRYQGSYTTRPPTTLMSTVELYQSKIVMTSAFWCRSTTTDACLRTGDAAHRIRLNHIKLLKSNILA